MSRKECTMNDTTYKHEHICSNCVYKKIAFDEMNKALSLTGATQLINELITREWKLSEIQKKALLNWMETCY